MENVLSWQKIWLLDMIAFYAGLGIVMITGVMAIVEMSMGFLNQQSNWKPAADPYFQITPAASLLDQSWLKALDEVNQMNINGSRINDLALWGLPSSVLSSCTCYLVERAVGTPIFNASTTRADDSLCLLPWSGNPAQAVFPDNLIAENSLSLQTTSPKFFAKSGDSVGLPSSCAFTRTIPNNPNNIQHRVIVSPNETKKVFEFYSCAFDDSESQCSFEKV
jgi:hypothetical protein